MYLVFETFFLNVGDGGGVRTGPTLVTVSLPEVLGTDVKFLICESSKLSIVSDGDTDASLDELDSVCFACEFDIRAQIPAAIAPEGVWSATLDDDSGSDRLFCNPFSSISLFTLNILHETRHFTLLGACKVVVETFCQLCVCQNCAAW